MSNENQPSPQEIFDKNEEGIALKKQEMNEAVAAGKFGKVAELAQEARAMEVAMEVAKGKIIDKDQVEATEMNIGMDQDEATKINEGIDQAKRQAELAEQQRLDAENSAKEAAEVLERLGRGSTESSTVENVEADRKELEESLKSAEIKMHDAADRWHAVLAERDKLYVAERTKKFPDLHFPEHGIDISKDKNFNPTPEYLRFINDHVGYSAELGDLTTRAANLENDFRDRQREVKSIRSKLGLPLTN